MKSELVKEVWKPVLGYEGLYEVSNFGRGRSLDRYVNTRFGKRLCRGKIIKPRIKSGYLQVGLSKNSLHRWFLVHRLVWETFVGHIPDGMQVNHRNEIKTDNFVFVNPDGSVDLEKSNLNLMTPKENINWGNGNDRRKKNNVNNPKQSHIVYQYTLDGRLVHVWSSAAEAGRNGFNKGNVVACCNGRQKSHKGFLWSYTPLN